MTSTTGSRTLVGSVMSPSVTSVDRKATLRDAAVALHKAQVGTLAVLDGGGIAGILSERDIVGALATGIDPDRGLVEDAMSGDPRYLTEGDPVGAALVTMLRAGVRHMPVVASGSLVGIVSIRDLAAEMVA